jgi:hypothetical protein
MGDAAEFLFDAKAIGLDMIVNRPIHPGTIYDRVVESDGYFYKVQIKCVNNYDRFGKINVSLRRKNNATYSKDRVDVFAVYFVPLQCWYLFDNIEKGSIYINPKIENQYLENWEIFYEKV